MVKKFARRFQRCQYIAKNGTFSALSEPRILERRIWRKGPFLPPFAQVHKGHSPPSRAAIRGQLLHRTLLTYKFIPRSLRRTTGLSVRKVKNWEHGRTMPGKGVSRAICSKITVDRLQNRHPRRQSGKDCAGRVTAVAFYAEGKPAGRTHVNPASPKLLRTVYEVVN